MIILTSIFLSSFLGTVLLTLPIKALAGAVGAMDLPDARKIHQIPTPRIGGIAFFLSFFLVSLWTATHSPSLHSQMMCAGALTVALGVSDDIYSLSPYAKLFSQISIAFCAVSLGARATVIDLLIFRAELSPILSYVISILFIVFLMNAFNFIDGMDGLAASLASVSLFSLLVIMRSEQSAGVFLTCALLGALFGFFPFNMNRASVFMGDSGSNFLGLCLACLSLRSFSGEIGAPLVLCLLVPMLDVVFAITRRLLKGKNPFTADRGHIHHTLYDTGFSQNTVVFMMTLFAICAATVGIILKI